jgi:hypothetical protein
MIKGFALDDDLLKQDEQVFGKNYFRELIESVPLNYTNSYL